MSDSVLIAIIGFVASAITRIIKHYLEKGNNNLKDIINSLNEIKILVQKTADGTRTITKYRLLKDMNELIERGYITLKELRDITALYHSYKDLEGNGVVTEVFERFKDLPIEKGGKNDR